MLQRTHHRCFGEEEEEEEEEEEDGEEAEDEEDVENLLSVSVALAGQLLWFLLF